MRHNLIFMVIFDILLVIAVIGSMGVLLPLALHFGNIDSVSASIDRVVDGISYSLAEPNQ